MPTPSTLQAKRRTRRQGGPKGRRGGARRSAAVKFPNVASSGTGGIFEEAFKNGNRDASASLRSARGAVITQKRNPKNWNRVSE